MKILFVGKQHFIIFCMADWLSGTGSLLYIHIRICVHKKYEFNALLFLMPSSSTFIEFYFIYAIFYQIFYFCGFVWDFLFPFYLSLYSNFCWGKFNSNCLLNVVRVILYTRTHTHVFYIYYIWVHIILRIYVKFKVVTVDFFPKNKLNIWRV